MINSQKSTGTDLAHRISDAVRVFIEEHPDCAIEFKRVTEAVEIPSPGPDCRFEPGPTVLTLRITA